VSELLETIEQKGIENAGVKLQRAVGHAKTLETVQRVIAGVEKAILCLMTESYDTTPALTVARSLKQAIKDKETARIAEAEDHFSNELYLWHLNLSSRDEAIQAYHLRRFCERTEEHLDSRVFEALTRFYRSLPHTELAQSKYDFAVTRLFAGVGENDQRDLRLKGEPLVEVIREMFEAWEDRKRAVATPEQIGVAIETFHGFIAEANLVINEFEKLIGTGLFNRLRLFKKELGELFYAPEVTAAAIECNVVVANKFSSLLAGEGEQIREAPAVCRDLTDILSDPTAIGSVSGTLNDQQLAELDQQAESSAHLSQLLRLLRISNSLNEVTITSVSADAAQSADSSENNDLPTELPVTLSGLAEDDENRQIISEFLRLPLSEERQSLDLATFLAPLAGTLSGDHQEERQVRRDSLSFIIQSERLLRFKLGNDNPIDAATEAELSGLLESMQLTDSVLRLLISDARSGSQLHAIDQLLHVSNHLLGARLKLQSVLVQRAGELARQKLASQQAEIEYVYEPPVRLGRKKQILAIAAAIVLVVCAGLVFRAFNQRTSAAIERRDKDVQMLNVQDLPGSEVLVNARTKKELMVAVVSRKWNLLTDEEKTKELEALLSFGKPIGVQLVMLVDSKGTQMGSASDSHLSLE
jgi:hypothetical protein